jgi:DNA-binding response OmpR family regulator
VKTLRERLSDEVERPRWIETVRGVGYRFREEAN